MIKVKAHTQPLSFRAKRRIHLEKNNTWLRLHIHSPSVIARNEPSANDKAILSARDWGKDCFVPDAPRNDCFLQPKSPFLRFQSYLLVKPSPSKSNRTIRLSLYANFYLICPLNINGMAMKIFIVSVILLCALTSRAQFLTPDSPPDAPIIEEHLPYSDAQIAALTNYYKRPFNVIRYNLYMDWRAPLASMSFTYPGLNIITLTVDSAGLSSILLDAVGMHIDSIRVNGASIPSVQPDNASETLLIPLGASHAVGDTITLEIGYTHTSDSLRGFYLYDKGTPWHTDTTPQRIAYTMSEPLDAHAWMPCMDLPYDKAKSEIRVAVPDSFTVSSNGLLQSITPMQGGGNVFDWKEDTVIATYLMCATASIFSHWTAYYVRQSNRADSVPIQYYVWQVDSTWIDGLPYNAALSFRNVPLIMHNFSQPQYYGEFPFPKYGMSTVEPFYYGGMEHQTQTTINRVWLNTYYEDPIAHEMSHQWFGDHVTCATWKDIWLNEGFATFSEALYNQLMFSDSAYNAYILNAMTIYLHDQNDKIAVYDPVGQGLNVFNNGTVYKKGGVVLHMLRRILGDSLFFGALRYHLAHFADTSATTDDLTNDIDTYTGQDFHWFFNEWIYGAGQPLYNTTEYYTPGDTGGFDIHVVIAQPDTTRQLFRMPITLQYAAGGLFIDNLVIDSLRAQEYVFHSPTAPDGFTFDPYNSILKDTLSSVTGIQPAAALPATQFVLSAAPIPARDNILLMYALPSIEKSELYIYDVLGRVMYSQRQGMFQSGALSISVQSYPAGVYAARLTSNADSKTIMFTVEK